MRLFYFAFFILIALLAKTQTTGIEKINGVNFVSPKYKSKLNGIDSLKVINANWIAICPFAFLSKNSAKIEYNTIKNWWGDTKPGMIEEIKRAKSNKLKILVKPHFWQIESGWGGDFDATGKTKTAWESNYKNYLLYLASLCDSLNVDMLSVGTELKTYTLKHPDFFIELIDEVRKVYKGELTYAANWDEYKTIKFWNKLDFIGIDAYFPLSDKKTPEVAELNLQWQKISTNLKLFSTKFNKKIIFTEYGYKSINYAANKQWEFENTPTTTDVNFVSQINAYTALYNSIWKEKYIAGGFLWKWHNDYEMPKNNSDYTPQRKPVQEIIKKNYSIK